MRLRAGLVEQLRFEFLLLRSNLFQARITHDLVALLLGKRRADLRRQLIHLLFDFLDMRRGFLAAQSDAPGKIAEETAHLRIFCCKLLLFLKLAGHVVQPLKILLALVLQLPLPSAKLVYLLLLKADKRIERFYPCHPMPSICASSA